MCKTESQAYVSWSLLLRATFSSRLLQCVRAGLGALTVLRAGAARQADRADDFAVHHERQAAFNGHRVLEPQDAKTFPAGSERILKRLRRALEQRGRARLGDRDGDAAGLRPVHLLEIH